MKWLILSSACFAITFTLTYVNNTSAQCLPSPQAWLDEIRSIENSDVVTMAKITDLHSLKSRYQTCGGQHDSVYAVLIHRLGSFYMRQHVYEEAILYTREAASINNSNTPVAQRSFLAHSYFNLALIYAEINLQANSLKYFDSCIQVASHYPEKSFIAFIAFEQQAFSFFQSGDYQKSIDIADKGNLMALREKDCYPQAILLPQKAQAQLGLNDIGSAEQNLQRSINLLEHVNGASDHLPTCLFGLRKTID